MVSSLLCLDPSARLSATRALAHPWMKAPYCSRGITPMPPPGHQGVPAAAAAGSIGALSPRYAGSIGAFNAKRKHSKAATPTATTVHDLAPRRGAKLAASQPPTGQPATVSLSQSPGESSSQAGSWGEPSAQSSGLVEPGLWTPAMGPLGEALRAAEVDPVDEWALDQRNLNGQDNNANPLRGAAEEEEEGEGEEGAAAQGGAWELSPMGDAMEEVECLLAENAEWAECTSSMDEALDPLGEALLIAGHHHHAAELNPGAFSSNPSTRLGAPPPLPENTASQPGSAAEDNRPPAEQPPGAVSLDLDYDTLSSDEESL